MKQRIFTIVSIVFAAVFWNVDAAIHYFVYGEPEFNIIPEDSNELWMRIVIILLIVLFGIFADSFSRKQAIKEKQLEAMHIYKSMMHATQHILNNLLNQMQLFRMEAERSKDFNRDCIKEYDEAFSEALNLVEKMSKVENITAENIDASVYPSNTEADI